MENRAMWGVIGAGGIARRRLIPEGIVPARNAGLAAVLSSRPESTREVAAQYGAAACGDEAELLASACDVVYVATPVHLHCDEVVRAAEAGKHVFCEKPLGLDVAEAERMASACAANGVKLGVGFMMRWHAQHQAALRLVRAGRLGTLVMGRAQLSCWYPEIPGAWRQDPAQGGGGSLMDLGGHCVDLLEMYFGPARRVCCMTGRLIQGYAPEDTATVLLEFESGAKGIVDCLFNVPDASSKNRLEIYGARGSILAEGTIGQGERGTMTAILDSADAEYDAGQARDAAGGIAVDPEPVNMYRAEVEAFSDAVLNDTPPPVDGAAGVWSQKVLAACYESARTSAVIDIR